ncbi:MAG TPA: helix-turn-helix domain-containing protein [Thermoanaerobaculia bacterium]|jgi:AcrR family transcriptional regulator
MVQTKSKEEVVQEYRIQSIQEATMRVIARKGMAAATMQEIAEEAGVAKGTIYLYFRDRDELVEKTFERAITDLIKHIDSAMDTVGSFHDKLRAALAAKISFFNDNREFFRLYVSLRLPEGNAAQQRRHRRTCEPQYKGAFDHFAAQLEAAMKAEEIRQFDSQRLALFIIESTNAIVLDRVMSEAPPPDEVDVAFMTDVLFDGIRKRS